MLTTMASGFSGSKRTGGGKKDGPLETIDPPGLVDAVHWAPGTQATAPAPAGGRILAAVARMR
jgi:hypothetical protein